MGAKPLRIRFHKINGYMKIYGGIRYLVLHDYKRYNALFDRIHMIFTYRKNIDFSQCSNTR